MIVLLLISIPMIKKLEAALPHYWLVPNMLIRAYIGGHLLGVRS